MGVGVGIAVVGALVLPLFAGAQPTLGTNITGYSDVTGIIGTVGNWMFGIILALAVIFILYAAFLYLTSGGDEEKVGTAKKYLVYAIIAVAVAVLSKGIVMVVQSFLPGGDVTPGT